MTFDPISKTFTNPSFSSVHSLADVLFKKNELENEAIRIADQLTKANAAIQIAKDAGVYHDGDDVGQPSSVAGLLTF